MNLSDELIKQLEQGMYGYNPVVYDLMDKLSKSLTAVGVALAVLFFWIEFELQARTFEDAGTTPDATSYAKLSMKYALTVLAIMNSGMILNFILWLTIQITKWSVDVTGSSNVTLHIGEGHGIWAKAASMISGLANIVAQLIVKVLILLRFIQMYVFKGIAPIILAFLAHKEMRANGIHSLKRFGGYALQGVVIVITVAVLAGLQKSLIFTLSKTGSIFDSDGLKGIAQSLVQSIVMIVAVLGTQKTAKDFLEH